MAFIRYEEATISVGYGNTDKILYATNATVGESMPLTPIRSLGFNGAIAVAPTGPVEGSWSVSYNLFSSSPRELCESSATAEANEDWQNPAATDFIVTKGYDPNNAIQFAIGTNGNTLFEKGLATSFSVSAEPNAIVSATAQGNFYDCAILADADSIEALKTDDGAATFDPAFGASTTIAEGSAGFSCNPFSASFEYTRGASPIYTLGATEAAFVSITDPQKSLTLQGSNLPYGVIQEGADCDAADAYCTEGRDLAFTVKSLCDHDIGDFSVCGLVTSRDVEVAVDDILRGNITVVDYAVVQKLEPIDCASG